VEWQSEQTLWAAAVEQAPQMARPRLMLGLEHAKREDWVAAVEQFTACVLLAQDAGMEARALTNIGTVHYQQDDMETAQEFYLQAVRVAPSMPDAHANLASIKVRRAHSRRDVALLQEAVQDYRDALALDPRHQSALRNLEQIERAMR